MKKSVINLTQSGKYSGRWEKSLTWRTSRSKRTSGCCLSSQRMDSFRMWWAGQSISAAAWQTERNFHSHVLRRHRFGRERADRQFKDFLVFLTSPLHRQYKTARTETRWHLLLKAWQKPTQTSASRGYVLFISDVRNTQKSLNCLSACGHTRGVLKTWKNTDYRRCKKRQG